MNPIYFVFLAGIFAGLFQISRKVISSNFLSPLFGATMFSLAAAIMGIILLIGSKFSPASVSVKNYLLAGLAGLLVLPIDFFILKAYQKGFPISTGVVILTGVSSLVALACGIIFLNESLKPIKLLAVLLTVSGILILKFVK